MKQVALILQDDVFPDEPLGLWKFIQSCLGKAEIDSEFPILFFFFAVISCTNLLALLLFLVSSHLVFVLQS